MHRVLHALLLATATVIGMAAPAAAYVGPGAGLSLLGALWAVLLAVFVALGFLIAWPLRRILKRRRTAPLPEAGAAPRLPQPSSNPQ